VPAEFLEQLGASAQGRDERQAGNAAATPLAHAFFVKPDNYRGAVITLRDTRGDDPENPRMPAGFTKHDRRRIESISAAIFSSAAAQIWRSTSWRSRFCASSSAASATASAELVGQEKAERFFRGR
jgi:hypothetical protein